MWSKIQRGCVLLFSGAFGLLWCWLSFAVLLSFNESKKIVLLATFLLVIPVLTAALLKKYFIAIWKNEKF